MQALLYRDVLMSLGVVDASRHSLEYVLTQKGAGHSVVIIVGGQEEILDTRYDRYVLTLKRRKGFIKLALQTGFVSDYVWVCIRLCCSASPLLISFCKWSILSLTVDAMFNSAF